MIVISLGAISLGARVGVRPKIGHDWATGGTGVHITQLHAIVKVPIDDDDNNNTIQ